MIEPTPPKNSYASLRKHPSAYAWRQEDGGLLHYAGPYPHELCRYNQPAVGDRPERVRIVPISDYNAMLAAWRKSKECSRE